MRAETGSAVLAARPWPRVLCSRLLRFCITIEKIRSAMLVKSSKITNYF